jgi:hypothetical protein
MMNYFITSVSDEQWWKSVLQKEDNTTTAHNSKVKKVFDTCEYAAEFSNLKLPTVPQILDWHTEGKVPNLPAPLNSAYDLPANWPKMLKSFTDAKTLVELGFARHTEKIRKKKKQKDSDTNDQSDDDEMDGQNDQPENQSIPLSFLIVDSSNSNYTAIEAHMNVLGHRVVQAFTVTWALQLVRDSITNSSTIHAVLIAAYMPSDETVIGGETVALQLRKLEYSGQVIVWNPEQPACTRSDKPSCSQSIDTLVEGI